MKQCYVCGKTIPEGSYYYNAGPNSYVCKDKDCFDFYFWDKLAARMANNNNHEYAIIGRKVYSIGSEKDEPQGFGGKFYAIQFNDGTYVETHSLWLKGDLPARLLPDFPDNAKFVIC